MLSKRITVNQQQINVLVKNVKTIINEFGDLDDELKEIISTIEKLKKIINSHEHDDDEDDKHKKDHKNDTGKGHDKD